jgi:non-specific serine/threonine protein kinase
VGGEAQEAIQTVYAYNVKKRRWSRLPDMRTPRHGLGVVAFKGRVYTLAGGPHPGLFVSSANEYLRIR